MGNWSSLNYILSQVFVVVAFIGYGTTYLIKNRHQILLTTILSNIVMMFSYFFLNAWVGLGVCSVSIIRDLTSLFLNHKREKEEKHKTTKLDWILLFVWIGSIFVITLFTQSGFWTWFAMFGTLSSTIGIWQKNILIHKLSGIFCSLFYIVYNTYHQSVFGVVLETCMIVAATIGFVLFINKKKIINKAIKPMKNN